MFQDTEQINLLILDESDCTGTYINLFNFIIFVKFLYRFFSAYVSFIFSNNNTFSNTSLYKNTKTF
jgi:hypothetical protein